MEQQLRGYFIGLISFGFVVTSISAGLLTALAGLLAAVAAIRVMPAVTGRARKHERPRRPVRVATPRSKRPRGTARALVEERTDELPLVPDEPSLIISLQG